MSMDLNFWKADEKYDVIIASYLHLLKNEREELFKKIEESFLILAIPILSFSSPKVSILYGSLTLSFVTTVFHFFLNKVPNACNILFLLVSIKSNHLIHTFCIDLIMISLKKLQRMSLIIG